MNNNQKNLDIYLKDIGGNDLLSDEQERALAERIANGDAEAANELAAANLRYVVAVARQYAGGALSMDDLVSEGNVGMLKAATKFKANGGKRFVAFAAPYIRKCIEAALKKQANLVSMDAPIPAGSQNAYTLSSLLEDVNSPQADAQIELEGLGVNLARGMEMLDEREKQVVARFYGIGMPHQTMAEIAADMGLKRERVRQIRNNSLRTLRKSNKGLKEE